MDIEGKPCFESANRHTRPQRVENYKLRKNRVTIFRDLCDHRYAIIVVNC